MTSPNIPSLLVPSYRVAALFLLLAAAACSDRAVGPTVGTLNDAALAASRPGGSCSTKDMTIEVHAFLESTGSLTIEATSPAGTSIEKIKVKLYDLRGKHAGEAEFNKIPANTGSASVSIPASEGVQLGWRVTVTVHVRGCRGKEKEPVRAEAIVTRRFDLSVVEMLMAAPIPSQDFPLQDAQLGVPTLYDVTVSNDGGLDVEASCNVAVNKEVTAIAQYWVDGSGNAIGDVGQPILIPGGEARVCRFSITYETDGTHTVTVSTSAVDGGETNLTNNSTSAEIEVLPGGNAPLVTFEWFLTQRDAVVVPPDRNTANLPSNGIIFQTAAINTYWDEPTTDVAGIDTWTFTVTSATADATFDSRSATAVSLQRITQSMLAAPGGQVCHTLAGSAASSGRAYLSSKVTVCAKLKPGDPTKTTMQLNYVVNSNTYPFSAPYTGSDRLLWGPTFSYTAVVEHTGAAGTNTYGGQTKTITLFPPIFEILDINGAVATGPNVRKVTYTQPPL